MAETGQKRLMRGLLIGSLALNLIVAGLVAGALWRGPDKAPRHVDLSFGPLGRAFEAGDRRHIGRDVQRRIGPMQARGARQAELGRTLEILRAEPFDPAPLAELLEVQRARGAAIARAGQEALVARIAGMEPSARARFADRLEAELARSEGRRARGDN